MTNATQLSPLPRERAEHLFDLLGDASASEGTALALDDQGRALGLVPENDPEAEHLLGDLDVHA